MVSAPVSLTILYTAAISGQLELLPRLMTRIRQERAASSGSTVLVDLGKSCAAQTWICEATNGRGLIVAMDAMGYDAFHIGAADPLYTQPAIVQGLRDTVQTPFAAGPWSGIARRSGLVFRFCARLDTVPPNAETADLTLILQLGSYQRADVDVILSVNDAGEDALQTRLLYLDAGWTSPAPLLGRVNIELLPDDPYIRVLDHTHLDIPANALPDATMSSIIEFVESEARRSTQKRGLGDE